jgi:hypothetical protein
MSRTSLLLLAAAALCACSHSEFAVRPVPSIVAENVGQPVSRLEEAFGTPRKVDGAGIKQVYVWFIPMQPTGAPKGFHGCEMEVTVDTRSQRVLGYTLSNIGWSNCREAEKRIRVASL